MQPTSAQLGACFAHRHPSWTAEICQSDYKTLVLNSQLPQPPLGTAPPQPLLSRFQISRTVTPLSLRRHELPSGGVQVGRGSSSYACGSGLQQGTGRAWPLRLRYGSGAPILCEAQGRAPPAVHGQGAAARACRSGAPATRRQDDGPSGSAYRSGTPAVRAAQGRALPAARG
jgi:hypothetical protein